MGQSLARWPVSLHRVHFLRGSGAFLRKPGQDIFGFVCDGDEKPERIRPKFHNTLKFRPSCSSALCLLLVDIKHESSSLHAIRMHEFPNLHTARIRDFVDLQATSCTHESSNLCTARLHESSGIWRTRRQTRASEAKQCNYPQTS